MLENYSIDKEEILAIKKVSSTGFGTEYVLVNSASRNDPSSETDFSGNIFALKKPPWAPTSIAISFFFSN